MSKRPLRADSPDIPTPDQLTVVEAGPTVVRLRWCHPGGNDIWFLICWKRDDEWWPVDETDGKSATTTWDGIFEYVDELPTSGTTQYAVRAFNVDGREQSLMSEPVQVAIVGPAAGDVE